MRVGLSVPASEATLTALLEGLTALNRVLLRRHKNIPWLYESGVRYRAERRGKGGQPEDWANITQVVQRGYGDCEDLSSARAAELQERCDEDAHAIVVRSGRRKFHAVVLRENGDIEDPSRILGMGAKQR